MFEPKCIIAYLQDISILSAKLVILLQKINVKGEIKMNLCDKSMLENFNSFAQFISIGNKVMYNVDLAHKIGLNEAIMYAELLNKYSYFLKEEKTMTLKDLDGEWFYYTIEAFEQATCLSKFQQGKAVEKLMSLGLIKQVNKKPKGFSNQTRFFHLIPNVEFVLSFLQTKEIKKTVKPIEGVRTDEKYIFESQESELSKMQKLDTNITNIYLKDNIKDLKDSSAKSTSQTLKEEKEKKKQEEQEKKKQDRDFAFEVLNLYNDICVDFKRSRDLTPKRINNIINIKNTLTDNGHEDILEVFKEIFAKMNNSPLWKANNKWKPNFDKIIETDMYIKALEGQYDNMYEFNKDKPVKTEKEVPQYKDFNQRKYDKDFFDSLYKNI
jgi:hypothetical protein